ncbi:MAG: acyl-CoA dehydrogenase family protein [Anaerolineales bacterium]|jgi:acyl-CoA dehydrogenase
MEFRLSAEQELFKRTIREWCEKNLEPIASEIDHGGNYIPDEIIAGLAELGVLGINIPEQYGGSMIPGQSMTLANIAVQELARAELSMSVPVYVLLQLGWSLLVAKHGTEELKQEVLPKVASGEYFLGICTTEPGGGSDVAAFKTHARQEDGKLIINGEKAYISGVHETSVQRDGGHLTLVRTDPDAGHRGFTFAYVPARSKGMSFTLEDDLGRGGLSTGGFVYKDVEIPEHYVLGEMNKGFYLNMEGFNVARVLVSSACVGAAEKAIELSRDYVKQRFAFGRPLAKFEGISFEIAEDYSELQQIKLYLQYTAWMTDQFYAEPDSFTWRDLTGAVSICKLDAPLLALDIIKHSMMYHGAFGFTKDCPLELAYRGVMSYVVGAEGGTNIQKLIIAREFVGDEAIPYR